MWPDRGVVAVVAVLVVLVWALPAPAPAQDVATCFGRRATIYEPGADEVLGTKGADVIVGAEANFTIKGRGGDDLICQGDAFYLDEVFGGSGNDMIGDARKTPGGNHYRGGTGDDLIDIREYNNSLGGPGDDRLLGGFYLTGGAGADLLVQRPGLDDQSNLDGGPGNDVLDGRSGMATAIYRDAPGVHVDLAAGVARGWGRDELISVENVEGSRFDDVLRGSAVTHRTRHTLSPSNDIHGGGGDDVIAGRGGTDWVDAGLGGDVVLGGKGNDDLDPGDHAVGQRSPNVVRGGPGDDSIGGGQGRDRLDGGAGDDSIDGQYGKNVVRGGRGDDVMHYGGRRESIAGGPGFDIAGFGVFGPVLVDLREQTARLGALRIPMSGIEGVFGSYFGDTLIGDEHANLLFDGGNYNVDAQEDQLFGGRGDDALAIQADPSESIEDELFVAVGGRGADTLTFSPAWDAATVDLSAGEAAVGSSQGYLAEIENVEGTRYDDRLSGDDGANRLLGVRRNDMISGRGGDDTLNGGAGTDHVDGGEGHDECTAAESTASCEEELMRADFGLWERLRAVASLLRDRPAVAE